MIRDISSHLAQHSEKLMDAAIAIIGAAIVAWTMLQTHEVRIKDLENTMDKHLTQHEQLKDSITKIQVDVSSINTKLDMMQKQGR